MQPLWLSEKVYFNGDDYFRELFADLARAVQLITVEMYIFNHDILGQQLLRHLQQALARGVKVEILMDGIGSMNFPDQIYRQLQEQGIRLRIYNPLPLWHPLYGEFAWGKKLQIYSMRIARINKRNHRKIITIDESVMYSGSFNITAEHTSLLGIPWKDMGVRVSGPQVKFAILNFKRNWKLRDYFRYKKQNKAILSLNWRHSPLRLNQTLLMKRYYHTDFLKRIWTAREKIWFVTPYFIPQRKLIRALGKAAQRGVDVQILSSQRSDVQIFRTLQYFYYPYLLSKGVKVFQYTDTVLHAKNYIIDNWVSIGTTNLNHRSFMHDLEADLVLQDEKNIGLVQENFEQLTHGLKLITLEELKTRPWIDRCLSRLFFLFKYWF
jgi:cardiolipin synthase A/B